MRRPDLTDFRTLLARVAAQFPTKRECAKALDISPTRLSHALNGRDDYPFNLENCLRLAKIAKLSPLEVLQVAHRDADADLVAYFALGTADLSGGERDLLTLWRQLEPEDHEDAMRDLAHVARLREKLRSLSPGAAPQGAAPGRETRATRGRPRHR